MKNKVVLLLGVVFILCACFSVDATQNVDNVAVDFKNCLGCDCSYDIIGKNRSKQIITDEISFQYTTDGCLQHVAIYENGIIFTNIEGPREGVQFIMMNTGAIMDMCHSYKKHKNYFVNKYKWGEVITYKGHQTIKVK